MRLPSSRPSRALAPARIATSIARSAESPRRESPGQLAPERAVHQALSPPLPAPVATPRARVTVQPLPLNATSEARVSAMVSCADQLRRLRAEVNSHRATGAPA
ncbi:MAG: hypothetical protein AB8H86_09470 [Polyangiales bacterium]